MLKFGISGRAFDSHHPSSEHFRADETARRIDRQLTIDGGSQVKRSFVSFSLCRPTEAQHPFHFMASKIPSPFLESIVIFTAVVNKSIFFIIIPMSFQCKQLKKGKNDMVSNCFCPENKPPQPARPRTRQKPRSAKPPPPLFRVFMQVRTGLSHPLLFRVFRCAHAPKVG